MITIGLFGVAMLVIHHELKLHPWSEIVAAVHETPWTKIGAAVGLTALSFVILIGYDWLGFKYIKYKLLNRKVAIAGFIGYAFSQSLGHSLVSGGSVRLRLYSGWGVPMGVISRIFLFGWLTLYLGLITLGGLLLTFEPQHASPFVHLPIDIVRAIGIAMLTLLASYLILALRRKSPFRVRGIEFQVPSFRLSLLQVLLASVDLAIAGCVLYVLLPDGSPVSLPAFLAVYLIAVIAGAASQLPGGIGVIEGIMLSLLTPELSQASVFGALLIYRVVYTLSPLILAACMLAGYELLERRIAWIQTSRTLGRAASWLIPNALALTTFIAGVILLFSGATPGIQSRMKWIEYFFPLPVIEGAHFLASIAGLVLIILARSLQLRLDAAYWLTLIFLAAGIVLSIIKGGDYEEAIALSIMLAAMAPCHTRFNRRSSVLHERFTPGWIVTILTTIGLTAWLVFFAYKHVEYSNALWWKFTEMDNAPRSMRAIVGVAVFAIVYVGLRMTKTATPRPTKPDAQALAKAKVVASNSLATYAYLSLLGDKNLMFSPQQDAFIMYADQGRSSIAMGDPIGNPDAIEELAWDFRDWCHQHRRWPVFYQVRPDNLDLYIDLGLSIVKIGEEGRVFLPEFSLKGSKRSSLRKTIRDIEAQSCSWEVVASDQVSGIMPELRRVSDQWLADKNTAEKGFSLGAFDESYIQHFPVAVLRRGDEIVAFMNLWCGAQYQEVSVDLMRYSPDAPDRAIEYLFCQAMLWGKGEGYQWFNLGMSPLSGLENRPLSPLWNRAGGLVYQHGEHFYNFKGLHSYKQKFNPIWTPKYLASPGRLALPVVLLDIATRISGGVRELVSK